MYQNGLCKRRKAVGSIIGGAFIVLIILAGYEFYVLNNRAQNNYQLTLNEMRNFDIDKNQEDLKVPYIAPDGEISTGDESVTFDGDGTFTLHIRNDGPQMITIEYIGLLIDGEEPQNTPCYQEVKLNILPAQVQTYELHIIDEHSADVTAQIQVVTNRGNVFPFEYPQDLSDYPYSYIVSGAISEVIGRILPVYDSFMWGIKPRSSSLLPYLHETWVVSATGNQECYVFSIDVRNFAADDLDLSDKTGLYFKSIKGAENTLYCYIVDYNELTNTLSPYTGLILPGFDAENQDKPTPITIYFAVDLEGGNPTSDTIEKFTAERYQVILGIYDEAEVYAQAFSLIAIEVN